eukprot:COSAG02_NODE_5828_length_4008_cov_3.994372_2_plen_363_part_00
MRTSTVDVTADLLRAPQIENCLVFQNGMSQQIKLADFENASVFGTVRDEKVTPYICPPEVATAISMGDTSQLIVSGAEDVWAVGVMVLRLLGLRDPFSSGSGSDSSVLTTISQLSLSDIVTVLRTAGVTQDGELESFLIGSRGTPGCLAVLPESRATVSQLLAKGWISGGHHTQFNREGAEAIRDIATRVDAMQEDINDLGAKLQQSLEQKIQEARERFERKLAKDMQQKQHEIAQTLAAANAEADASDAQIREQQAQAYAAELKQLRSLQLKEREAHSSKLEALRRQFDGLQKEKLDGLLEAEASAAERAKSMMNDLTQEGGQVSAKVQVMQRDEQIKLRARLEARQRKRAERLLEQIEHL